MKNVEIHMNSIADGSSRMRRREEVNLSQYHFFSSALEQFVKTPILMRRLSNA